MSLIDEAHEKLNAAARAGWSGPMYFEVTRDVLSTIRSELHAASTPGTKPFNESPSTLLGLPVRVIEGKNRLLVGCGEA